MDNKRTIRILEQLIDHLEEGDANDFRELAKPKDVAVEVTEMGEKDPLMAKADEMDACETCKGAGCDACKDEDDEMSDEDLDEMLKGHM